MPYKVIEILNEDSILINYGFVDKAEEGDRLRIYQEGEEVIDPDTKEPLGTLDRIKEIVEVVIPYHQFSYCRKVVISDYSLLNPLTQFQHTRKRYEKLDVFEPDITHKKFPEKDPIKVGDLVELVE